MLYISPSFLNTFITTNAAHTKLRFDVAHLNASFPTVEQAQQAIASDKFEGVGRYEILFR